MDVPKSLLELLVKNIDGDIYNKAEEDLELEGMGSTLVCILLRDRLAYWVHGGMRNM